MEEKIIEDAWRDFLIIVKNDLRPGDDPWTDDEVEFMRICWVSGSKTMFNLVFQCLRKNDQVRYRAVERQLNEFAAA